MSTAYTAPRIASVIMNPTDRDLKYGFIGTNGICVKSMKTVTLPYCVYTAANRSQRKALETALSTKMVKIKYLARGIEVENVQSIVDGTVWGELEEDTPADDQNDEVAGDEQPPNGENPDDAAPPADPAPPEAREKVINAVGDGKDAVEDSKDIVQKATGQETVGMREAMGWEDPATNDTREDQKAEVVTMEEALTEEVGDPIEKAAAAFEKDEAAKKVEEAAAPKTPAVPEAVSLTELSWAEVKEEAKKLGIPAKGKRADLEKAITEARKK